MKLIPLQKWAKQRYGEDVPSSRTLRRWTANGNIMPRPRKEGRRLWVPENAQYIDLTSPDYVEDVARALNEAPQ